MRNVKVTVPDVVGVHVNVAESPAVIVKPSGIVGGFDVFPDCAAIAVKRYAIMKSGEMRIVIVVTEYSRHTRLCERETEKSVR